MLIVYMVGSREGGKEMMIKRGSEKGRGKSHDKKERRESGRKGVS